jgi:Tfp pilus assembly protein PilW
MTIMQRNRQNGFSVVELMIAMLLSMTLAGAIISVFVNNNYSFKQDENVGRMASSRMRMSGACTTILVTRSVKLRST